MTTYSDPLTALFDLATDDPKVWHERIAMLRREFVPKDKIAPAYVNNLRFGGKENVNVLESELSDPRAAFLEEWDRKVRHRKLWEHFKCDPAYDAQSVAAVQKYESEAGLTVPASLAEFVVRQHAHELVFNFQPTNNSLIAPNDWVPQSAPGGYTVQRVIDENQGCCFWYVAWKSDEITLDPPVFVGDIFNEERDMIDEFFEQTKCTANHWSEFLYDYAIEGEKWYEENPEYRPNYRKYDRAAPQKSRKPR